MANLDILVFIIIYYDSIFGRGAQLLNLNIILRICMLVV